MPSVKFSELPENLRVKLSNEGTEELWHRVDEFGGIKSLSESFEFSQSKMYNWKNKELAVPLKFVRRLMGSNNTKEITLLKGKSSSKKIKNPEFPLNFLEEFLTRVNLSVKLNEDGIPFYITSEKSLAKRFIQLLNNLGQVEHRLYSRENRYEVRYPKFLHDIIRTQEFSRDLPAAIDEAGNFKEGRIILEDQEIEVSDVEGKLYSREKSFEMALQRGNSEKITELMAEESSKVQEMIGN